MLPLSARETGPRRRRTIAGAGAGAGAAIVIVAIVVVAMTLVALGVVPHARVPAAVARPADSVLDLLQLGSRADLGLGGDPFLSPVMGQSGWWYPELLLESSPVRIRQHQVQPVTARLSDDQARFERVFTEVGVRASWSFAGRTLRAGAVSMRGSAEHRWGGDEADVSLHEDGTRVEGQLRIEDVVEGLRLQASFPLARTSSDNANVPLQVGVHYGWRDRLFVQSRASRWWYPLTVRAELEGELVRSPLNLASEEAELGVRLRLWRDLAWESRLHDGTYRHDQGRTGAAGYEFVPEAKSELRQHGLGWGRPHGVRAIIRSTRLRLEGAGNGYWSGQRYLRVSHGDVEVRSWLAGLELPARRDDRIVLDVERTTFEGFGRVEVESWRFVSWEQTWVGGKKVVQLGGDGRWWRYHAGYEARLRRGVVRGGLSWYEVSPDVYAEWWTSIPFTRRRDYERFAAGSDRYSLGAVSLGATLDVGRVVVSLGLHQFVYADDHLDGSSGDGPGEHGGSGGVASDRPSGWVGGTFAELTLGYRF